jgi:threonine/homoserine/homoserine lactone efflux protein
MPITSATLLSFVLTCLVIEITPGPNMGYLAILSATHGRRAGYVATAGIAVGLLTLGIAAGLGLAAIILQSQLLYETLRWCGVAYLLWLAWEGWSEAEGPVEHATEDMSAYGVYFWRGLITNLLNPKAALFFLSVLPEFLDVSRRLVPQTLTLSAAYVLVATVIHLSIVALAGIATGHLADASKMRMARKALSALLALIAVWLAFSTKR